MDQSFNKDSKCFDSMLVTYQEIKSKIKATENECNNILSQSGMEVKRCATFMKEKTPARQFEDSGMDSPNQSIEPAAGSIDSVRDDPLEVFVHFINVFSFLLRLVFKLTEAKSKQFSQFLNAKIESLFNQVFKENGQWKVNSKQAFLICPLFALMAASACSLLVLLVTKVLLFKVRVFKFGNKTESASTEARSFSRGRSFSKSPSFMSE